jgi:hypothetical protein
MGYLSFGRTLDLTRATVSLWFRVTSEAVSNVNKPGSYWDFPVFLGTVPLIVFGKQPTFDIYYDVGGNVIGQRWVQDTNTLVWSQVPVYGDNYVSHEAPAAPSYIGVNFFQPSPYLEVNLQTGDFADCHQTTFGQVGYSEGFHGASPFIHTWKDFSYTDSASPEVYGNVRGPIGPPVSIDAWHHLLLSWDVTPGCATQGSDTSDFTNPSMYPTVSILYCAIDGQNQSGANLPGYGQPYISNPNGMVSYTAMLYAGASTKTGPPSEPGGVQNVNGATSPPSVQLNNNQGIQADGIFIPAEPEYGRGPGPNGDYSSAAGKSVRPIYRIELAELMIWSGTLLTPDHATEFFDINGAPISADNLQQRFGRADIALVGSDRAWITGEQSGRLPGNFSKVGTITPFTGPKFGT